MLASSELITNYGNLVPVNSQGGLGSFDVKLLSKKENLEHEAAIPQDEFDAYLNRTSQNSDMSGVGRGSQVSNTLEDFILDKRNRENAEMDLLNAQNRSNKYNAEYDNFQNLKDAYGNLDVDYTNIPTNDAIFMKQLHQVEAGGKNPTTPNANGYIGMYQQRYRDGDIGSIWAKKNGYTPDQILKSPKLQNKMLLDQMGQYRTSFSRSGISPNNYNMFLAHNQGMGGARAILSGRLTDKIRSNIRNQGISGKNDYELIGNYHKKFRHRFAG